MASDAMLELYKASKGAAQAATYSGELVRMATRGQFKMNMEVLGSDAPMGALSKIINRLTIGIIIAGLFIGASMLVPYGGDAQILGVPVISFFAFLGSFILSVWVIADIWRKG